MRMANVYRQPGSRYWWGRIYRNGRRLRRSLKTTSRAQAEKRLREWQEELDAVIWGEQPARTYDEAMLHFLESHVPNLKPASGRRYETSARHLSRHLSGLLLNKVTSGALSGFEGARRAEGASPPTIRRDLACLSSMFETAIADWDLGITNPVGGYLKKRARRGLKESPPRRRYLGHEEEQRLLAACDGSLGAMVAFAIDSGLRLEEQMSLTWPQIDLAAREITLAAQDTKTAIGRQIPILPRSLTILRRLPRHIRSHYVFHKAGSGARYLNRRKAFETAIRRAGIKPLSWHDLRRTCGCRLLQDHGLSLHQVAKWLGHRSVTQTERAYAFLEVAQLHKAIDLAIGTADSQREKARGQTASL